MLPKADPCAFKSLNFVVKCTNVKKRGKYKMLQSVKISELPSADTLTEDDLIVVDQPDDTKKATLFQVVNEFSEQIGQNILSDLKQSSGAGEIGAEKGGTVEDYLIDISVDALGDFKNDQDGCAEAIMAEIQRITGMIDSAYVAGQKKFISVRFGNGNYTLKDCLLYPGVKYSQAPFGRIRPHPDGQWAFTTEGTAGVPLWQRLMYAEIDTMVIGDRWEKTGDMPAGKGGINLKFASYFRLRNIACRHLDGMAIYGGEIFDCPFDNVSIMYCGNNDDPNNLVPCFRLDNAGGTDATNACHFNRFHLEANHAGMVLNKCRHLIFTAPKIERDETSHLLQGCQGVTFSNAGLTWNYDDKPQFLISEVTGVSPSDSRGVKFEAPSCISSSRGKGWYFHHDGNAAPLEINNHFASGIKRLATGRRIKIFGGSAYDCGPTMVVGDNNVTVDNVEWRALRAVTVGDGSDDTIIFKGTGCAARKCKIESQAGSATDGGAFINTTATTDTEATGNTFGGYRQYGVRGALSNDVRDNKIDPANAHVGAITNQSSSKYTLTNTNKTGLGVGSINSGVYTLAPGTNLSPAIVGGCSKILARVIIGGQASSAEFLADSSISGLGVGPILGTLLSFSAGSAGDGLVHITKPSTGGSVTITNNSVSTATVVILAITAHG